MIKQILKIAQSCAGLNILAVATADGGLSLTFIPKLKEGADPLMATPLTLKGTAEELEDGIAAALDEIHTKRETLAETIVAANAVLVQATKDAAAKATEKKAVKSKAALTAKPTSAKPTVNAQEDGEDDDAVEDEDDAGDGGSESVTAAAMASASSSAAPAATDLNLFA